MTVRALKACRTIEAVLPHGPMQQTRYDDGELEGKDRRELYDIFLERLEHEVAGLMCLEVEELKRICGRRNGPQFVV